jgi:ABC-2 type transport system permease protein
MGNLLKAEFRKILTTKMWWALLIPAIALALGWAWLAAMFFTDVGDAIEDAINAGGLNDTELSLSSLALTRAMNFASLFPMVFGALALSSEISRKTITTSFLTASSRAAVLGAKAIVYTVWGLVYGIVVALAASLGIVFGTTGKLPDAGDWMIILVTGVLSCLLWTLLGMGVGALLGSPVAALLVLLLYAGLVGPVAELLITAQNPDLHLAGVMPNGSANGLTGSTAAQLLYDQIQNIVDSTPTQTEREQFDTIARAGAGAPGAFAMWLSGLIFLVWTAIFFVGGLLRNNNRDIT